MNLTLKLAYDGTNYLGWQKTKTGPSIESTLQVVLEKILQHPTPLQAASRTDRGVHANGQVVNFFTNKYASITSEITLTHQLEKLKNSLNDLLPKDIVILDIERKDKFFHPTLHAIKKEYHYYICNSTYQLPFYRSYSWHVYKPLNINRMQNALQLFIGTHDFSAFCNSKKNEEYESKIRFVENIEIIQKDHQRLQLRVIGANFLYKMVRNIVGSLVYIGSAKLDYEHIEQALVQKNRSLAGITAPAHGLFLHKIYY